MSRKIQADPIQAGPQCPRRAPRNRRGRAIPRCGRAPLVRRRGIAIPAAMVSLLSASALVLVPSAAWAQRATTLAFEVTTTADAHDAHPGDGKCADAAGQCTLRAAIEEANASPAGSTVRIGVPAGVFQLVLGSLAAGSAQVPLNLTVDGAGPARTVIRARGKFRVMTVAATATTVLENLQVTGGRAGPNSYGGGILSAAALTLFNDLVTGNRAGAGGGVANAGGSLVVTGSRITNNDGGGFGGGGIQNGGPRNVPGSVLVASSTISGNVTGNEGGGIFSGQNGRPGTAGRPAMAPRRFCPRPHCAGRRVPGAASLVLTVVDSRVLNNKGLNGGGGIAAEGPARVLRSQIEDNTAGGAIGGGLFNVGTIQHSTVSGNRAAAGGGMEVFPSVRVTITSSTLAGNHAQANGGAIDDGGNVTVTRSTISGNVAGGPFQGFGPAVEIEGGATLQVSDSTVAGNLTRPPGRAAIDNFGGSATLSFDTFSANTGVFSGAGFNSATGTILASSGTTPDCASPLHETAGFNLATDTSCGLSRKTDLITAHPSLGPLADNGGSTMTVALLPGSPAIDAGGLPATSGCPVTDQRGRSRPWGPACDIGAFELHYHQ
jgi:CSLREA domain-containing protein